MAKRKSPITDKIPSTPAYYGQPFPKFVPNDAKVSYQHLQEISDAHPFDKDALGGGGSTVGTTLGSQSNPLLALLGDSSMYSQFMGMLGKSGAGDNSAFLQLLLQIAAMNTNKPGTISDDLQKALIDMFLKNMTSQEQRQFDIERLNEQRQYDSPTNQLARLMGAGISRDAALQMLQQGQDPSLVGSGADAATPDTGTSPTENTLNAIRTGLDFIQGVSGLVQLGFSIPTAIQQITYMKNQNYLTGLQRTAYDSAGRAFTILSNAGAAAESFGSVGAAAKQITKLAENGDADAVSFIQSGGLQKMKASAPFSSQTLQSLYKSERAAGDYRKEFKLRMRQQRLQNDYLSQNINKVYQETQLAIANINKMDAETQKIYQDLIAGNLQIELLGQAVTLGSYQVHQASFEDEVLTSLEGLTTHDGQNASTIMAQNTFYGLWELFEQYSTEMGSPEQIEAYRKYLNDNKDALFSIAFVKAAQSQNQRNAWTDNGDVESAIRLGFMGAFDLFKSSGVLDLIKLVPRHP